MPLSDALPACDRAVPGGAAVRRGGAGTARRLLEGRGLPSVAAEGFKAPGVVVSYTSDPEIQSSRKFLGQGLQTAAGVPLQCDEGSDFRTFRLGLVGLEKLGNVERSVRHLERALQAIAQQRPRAAAD